VDRRRHRGAALVVGALALAGLAAGAARAQSAADLSARLRVDAATDEWNPVEAGFASGEESRGDSPWSAAQDVRQIHVTWDGRYLYVAVEGSLGGHVMVLWLDYVPGGLARLGALDRERRAVRFGPEIRPEVFLTAGEGQVVPGLYRATGEESAERLPVDSYSAAASFDGPDGGVLEAALPWSVLFPPTGGSDSISTGGHGLRLAAAVVHVAEGLGAADVAPDPTGGVPSDPRSGLDVDRALFVAWDVVRDSPPFDFGVAVGTQSAPRFVPSGPAAGTALRLGGLRTFFGPTPSRLLLESPPAVLDFAFEVAEPAPAALWLTATVYSLRGAAVRTLYRDVQRTAGAAAPPLGPFGDAAVDRWDGRDDSGRALPGGMYVLRLQAGLAPGSDAVEARSVVTVVR
jgi:hypothetical protein